MDHIDHSYLGCEGYTAHVGGHWGTFRNDLGAALRVWKRFPALPLITVGLIGIQFLFTSTQPDFVAFLAAIFVGIYWLGWVGTERMWYLRGFRGLTITAGEAWGFTRRFVGRFLWLGVLVIIPYIAVLLPLAIVFGDSVGSSPDSLGYLVALAIATLILDVVLTFVTPALVFSTESPTDALKIGWRMLRDGWPGTAWYAVLPPMAFLLLTSSQPPDAENRWMWAIASCVAGLLNLLAKGAVAALYLREHPEVGNDGAAFDDQVVPAPTPAGWTAPTNTPK